MAFTYNPNMKADYASDAGESKFSVFRAMPHISKTTAIKNGEIMSCVYKKGVGSKGEWEMMTVEVADWQNNVKAVCPIFINNAYGAAIFNDLLGLTQVADCELETVETQSGYTFQKVKELEGKRVDVIVEIQGVRNGRYTARTAGFFLNGYSCREIAANAQKPQDAGIAWNSCRQRADFAAEYAKQNAAPAAPIFSAPSQPPRMPSNPYAAKAPTPVQDPLPNIPHGPVTVQKNDDIPF